jgi:hypothetical protein
VKNIMVEHEITFYIGGAQEKITQRLFSANDMAYVFGIDTSVIVHFNKNSVIEKVVEGPPELEGKWDLYMMATGFLCRNCRPWDRRLREHRH